IAQIISVVSFAVSSQRDDGAMMKIIVPNCVEIVAALPARSNQFRFLPLVLRDQNNLARTRCLARGASDCPDDVFVGRVFHLVGRVESKTVKMKFVDPVATVSDEKFADRVGFWAVKINRLAPIVFEAGVEIMIGESANVVAVRTEVVVNDVENDGQA